MKATIKQLRNAATRIGFSVYQQGSSWILSAREEEQLHHSIQSERDALCAGLKRAVARGLITDREARSLGIGV